MLEPLGLPLLIDLGHLVAFPNLALSADAPPTTVAAGYRDNGAPGLRDYLPGYYAAYLLDRDGTTSTPRTATSRRLDPDVTNIEATCHEDAAA